MNYFPTRLAIGDAFCNREKEQERLIKNIQHANPTLIMSPRRYGKTSLVLHVLKKQDFPFAHIDFYKELNINDIEHAILNGAGRLLGSIESTPKRLLKLGAEFFSNFHGKVGLGLKDIGLQLEINRAKKQPKDTILKVLEKLHDLAEKHKKKMVLFLDEFQIISEVTQDYSIEAAIREAAQKSTYIAYIFSGSNRHLLEAMFFDKKKPFYNLCDIMTLERISAEKYITHIKKTAKKAWKHVPDDDAINVIFAVTRRHPYYVNRLCNLLLDEKIVNEKTVLSAWDDYVRDSQSRMEASLSELPINQRRMLILIANNDPVSQLYASDMMKNSDMSSGSISRVIHALKQKDYIYINEDKCYCILDPLIEDVLKL